MSLSSGEAPTRSYYSLNRVPPRSPTENSSLCRSVGGRNLAPPTLQTARQGRRKPSRNAKHRQRLAPRSNERTRRPPRDCETQCVSMLKRHYSLTQRCRGTAKTTVFDARIYRLGRRDELETSNLSLDTYLTTAYPFCIHSAPRRLISPSAPCVDDWSRRLQISKGLLAIHDLYCLLCSIDF